MIPSLKKYISIIWLFILTTALFNISLDIRIIDPTNIKWIMDAYHDWGQHYLGWEFFRHESWTFPLGEIANYNFPVGSNIGYTDSIPLLAIFFKIFSKILPENFQYLGLWMYISYLLLAFYTIKILNLYKINHFFSFLIVVFVLTNPVLIFRAMHPALFGHWIIVAAIYFYLKTPAPDRIWRDNSKLLGLILFSSVINPYLFAMVFGFSIIIPLKQTFFDRCQNAKNIIIYPFIVAVAVFVLWFLIGFIKFETSVDMNVGNSYGLYGLNLNALINSFGFSNSLPSLEKVSDYQYEGYMYLGLGMIILLLLSIGLYLYLSIKKSNNLIKHRKYFPLFLLNIILSIFAITGTVTFGNHMLLEIQLPKMIMQIGEIFRASARFFWLSYYLILFGTFIYFLKSPIANSIKYIILSLLFLVQIYDIQPILNFRNLKHGKYQTPFNEEKWLEVFKEFNVICTYPPFENHLLSNMDYQDLDFLALKEKKPITNGYVARDNLVKSIQFKNSIELELISEINSEYLFITTSAHIESFRTQIFKNRIVLSYLDGYFLVYSKTKQIPLRLSTDNQKMIDSIVAVYSAPSSIQRCNLWSSIEKGLNYNIESFYNEKNVLKASGWAFLANKENNLFDSVYIALSNDKFCYLFKANQAKRTDLNAHFNRNDLEYSGFNLHILSDSLINQKLNLSFVYLTKENEMIFCPTSKWINDSAIPTESKISYPEESSIKFNVEQIQFNAAFLELSGWAFIPNQNASENNIKLIFESNNQKFVIETEKFIRKDVTHAFSSENKLDNSGFKISFHSLSLPADTYHIRIAIFDNLTKEYISILTNREITITK